jgi:hypothetical protein
MGIIPIFKEYLLNPRPIKITEFSVLSRTNDC